MNKCFEFRLIWNDADVLELRVSGGDGRFAGTAELYEARGDLAEAARELEGFPLDPFDERELLFGAFGPDSAGGAVRMHFYCRGLAGHTFVEVWFESPFDESKETETAHFRAKVEASAIDTFVAELRRVEADLSGVARLVTI